MSKVFGKQPSMNLYKTILELKDLDECYRFFQDLCTVSELRAMEQRFDVAVLLQKGMIYNDILEQTGASSATISRVNRALNYGVEGYHQVFARVLGEEYLNQPDEKGKRESQKGKGKK
jgi:TrpR-related protein YerC/YecD